jgi:hypothetical protein
VFDRGRRFFWIYRSGNGTAAAVTVWEEAVAAGRVAPEGPGTGVLGRIREGRYDRRAAGEPTIEIVPPPAVLAVGFALTVVIVVAATVVRERTERGTRRKED